MTADGLFVVNTLNHCHFSGLFALFNLTFLTATNFEDSKSNFISLLGSLIATNLFQI